MRNNQDDVLVERVRRHCQNVAYQICQQRGRNYDYKHEYGFLVHDSSRRTSLVLQGEEAPLPVLAFPSATEEQLQETEEWLGFPLPPLLRLLYTRVANGGFGPGYGITGVIGGCPLEDDMGNGLIDAYFRCLNEESISPRLDKLEMQSNAQWYRALKGLPDNYVPASHLSPRDLLELTPEQLMQAMAPDEKLSWAWEKEYVYEFPFGIWPDRLLPFCYQGCAMCENLDVRTGRIFLSYASWRPDHFMLEYRAASLAEWLENWLRGER